MMGASVTSLVASKSRTFVLWAKTNKGTLISRDGGLSYRDAGEKDIPEFVEPKFSEWLTVAGGVQLRVNEASRDAGLADPAREFRVSDAVGNHRERTGRGLSQR
jgi:hypothetical protein